MGSSKKFVPDELKTPVTIITGFLGAGKTTLVNHILHTRREKRVAVIENEFGEVNIDKALVCENLIAKEDLVSLENGCVCCSLRSDIVGALAELDKRADKERIRFDAVLLETTGLADPAPVAFTFFANPWIGSKYKLDSILCLVDAQHIRMQLEEQQGDARAVNEAANQIAFADTILLNKTDLVTPKEMQKARELVRSINMTADLIECQLDGNPPGYRPEWERLIGVNSFSIERALQVDPTFMDSDSDDEEERGRGKAKYMDEKAEAVQKDMQQPNTARAARTAEAAEAQPVVDGNDRADHTSSAEHSGRKEEAEEQTEHGAKRKERAESTPTEQEQAGSERQPKRRRKRLHDLSGVGSVGISAKGPLDQYRFNMFMRDLLAEKAQSILRSKGVLCVHGQERTKFVFQGVHETICFGPAAEGWGDSPPMNQIVLIGRNLPRKELVEGFRSCVWVPLPEGWVEHFDKRTGQPYYVNRHTGQKQWERPLYACALVHSSHASAAQPWKLQPRRVAKV